MPQRINFNTTELHNLPQTGRRVEYPTNIGNLVVRVEANGRKKYCVRTRVAGKQRLLVIGDDTTLKISEVRKAVRDALEQLQAAVPAPPPPIAAKASSTGWGAIVDAFAAAQRGRLSSIDNVVAALKKHTGCWWTREAASITRREILERLGEIGGTSGPVAANRLMSYIRRVFNWAIDGERIDAVRNPAARLDLTDQLGSRHQEAPRDRTLSDSELRAVLAGSVAAGWPWGYLTRLLLFTGCRRSEIAGLRRSEVKGDVLVIAADRMKAGREHHVPLAPAAKALIDESIARSAGDEFVFSTTGRTAISGFDRGRKAIEGGGDWTFHDLRRTARTKWSEMGVATEVAELMLAHTPERLVRTYDTAQRLAERRAALDAWADRLNTMTPSEVLKPSPLLGRQKIIEDLTITNAQAARLLGVSEAAVRKARLRSAATR